MVSIGPISYTVTPYSFVTDQVLEKCSALFNGNYGVWSVEAPLHSNNALKAGERVKLGVKRLREMMLFNDSCFLVTAEVRSSNDYHLIGHAFCSWARYNPLNGNLVWIAQLVVSSSHRGRGVAGNLLSTARNSVEDVVVIGLVSSHPHAIRALCNACNRTPIDLQFISNHAKGIVEASNVPYLSQAQLVGSLFNKEPVDADSCEQPVSLVRTNFFVDHGKVLAILKDLGENWILGPLFEGHEFFVILPASSVRRSNPSSKGSPSSSSSNKSGSDTSPGTECSPVKDCSPLQDFSPLKK